MQFSLMRFNCIFLTLFVFLSVHVYSFFKEIELPRLISNSDVTKLTIYMLHDFKDVAMWVFDFLLCGIVCQLPIFYNTIAKTKQRLEQGDYKLHMMKFWTRLSTEKNQMQH